MLLTQNLAPGADDLGSHVVAQAALHGGISIAQSVMVAGVMGGDLNWRDIAFEASEAALMAGIAEEARSSQVSELAQAKAQAGGYNLNDLWMMETDLKAGAPRTLIVYGDPPRTTEDGDINSKETFSGKLTKKNTPAFEAGLKREVGNAVNQDLSDATLKRITNLADLKKAVASGSYQQVIYYGHGLPWNDHETLLDPGGGTISAKDWAQVMKNNGVRTTAIMGCDGYPFAVSAKGYYKELKVGGVVGDRTDIIVGDNKTIARFQIVNPVTWFKGN
jgi:hypothetical protein